MTARYSSGTNVAYIGESLVVVTPALGAAELQLGSLESLPLLEVIGQLANQDFSAVPEFAIVVDGSDGLRVLVRGDYEVRVGGTLCLAADTDTWAEHWLEAVESGARVRISRPGVEPDFRLLPLTSGIALVDFVEWSSSSDGFGADPKPDPKPEPEPEPEPAPEPEPLPLPASPPAGADLDPAETRQDGDDVFDAMFGATIAGRRPQDAAVREVVEIPPPPPDEPGVFSPAVPSAPAGIIPPPGPASGDHEGRTMPPQDWDSLPTLAPGSPVPMEQLPVRRARAWLQLSTGGEMEVDRPILIGRAPRSSQTSSSELPALVLVDDPHVSSTHLVIAFDGEVLLATDQSTNGTMIVRPSMPPDRLVKGQPTPVSDGTLLTVSDQMRITVRLEGG